MPFVLLLFWMILASCQGPSHLKIACIGDSITYGAGMVKREKNAYPQLLQEMLGEAYMVKNYGVNGRTVLRNGDLPYTETPAYRRALADQPDLVFILLGTNDSKLQNRKHLANLEQDYLELIRSFQELESDPRLVLLLPPPSFLEDTASIWDPVIRRQIRPVIQKIAYEQDLELIDLYPFFSQRPDLMPDKIHPSSLGASVIARRLFETVMTGRTADFDLLQEWTAQGEQSEFNFHGFRGADLIVNGRPSKVVQPKYTAPGKPWIWRARFWGHEPQMDIALLERGFHVVYTDVADLFGAPAAVGIWNEFYDKMVAAGLSPKVALEGMSRGGLIIYNWALANPEKVAAIYADAPVLDIKSWPGGKQKGNGSPSAWEKCRQAYGFDSEAEALAFTGNPVDRAALLAEYNIPALHVSGLADEVVPYEENTGLLARRVRAHGGTISLINKENIGHHPHSLPDPTPIADFILEACRQKINLASIPQPASEYRSAAGWKEGCDWHCNQEEINRILEATQQVDILFLGNSITQGIGGRRKGVTYKPGLEAFQQAFGKYKWVNAGISGDRTEHILWRLQHGNYQKAAPKIVVLTIGVNNFPYNSATQIAEGIMTIDNYVSENFPATRLIVSGPLPTGMALDSDQRRKYKMVHKLLAEQLPADHYFPIGNDWLLPSGDLDPDYFSRDGIHLIKGGYEAWAKSLVKILEK